MDLIIGNLEEWASWISVSQFQKVQLPGRIDKIFLIVFQSLWFKKKKKDGWMTTLRCLLGPKHLCLYIRCLGVLFYNLSPSSSCFLWAFHKEHSYLWPFYAEGFIYDVHGELVSVSCCGMNPCVCQPLRGALMPRRTWLMMEVSSSFSLSLLCFGDMIWQVVCPNPCNNEPCIMRLPLFLFPVLFALNETLKLSLGL